VFHKSLQILFNHNIGEGYYCAGFSCAEMAKASKPGQFLMLRIADQTWEGKLNRPFSISNIKDDIIEIVFEAVGRNTQNLSEAEKGRMINVIAPLGNGFEIDREAQAHLLIAGGIGIAPFPYLASRILQECPHSKIAVLFGVRAKFKLLLTEFFKEYKIELKVSSDDGSVGEHGFVTTMLSKELDALKDKKVAIYACGPKPMLKATASIAKERDIRCEISLEEVMACGVGACLGCACKTRVDGGSIYKMVCKDGPVFDAKDVIFDEN
jgi:dihydroorotate dehydrogenase electron transfer subunit